MMYRQTKFAIPVVVKEKIENWIDSDGLILHVWYDEMRPEISHIFYVIVLSGDSILFLRLFCIGDKWELFQDNARLFDDNLIIVA